MTSLLTGEGQVSALLSPAESRVLARPLRAWSLSQVAVIQDACQAVYDTWCREWGLPAGKVHVADVCSASEYLDDGAAEDALLPWLFGEHPFGAAAGGHDMASQLCARAWDAWQVVLAPLAPPVSSSHAIPAWSGRLVVAFPWGDGAWRRLLEGETVERLLNAQEKRGASDMTLSSPTKATRQAALVPLNHAMANHPLSVLIQLQPVALSLAQLQSLSLGDVVTLDHRLSAPALVHLDATNILQNAVAAEPPLCTAWLGQVNGRMAVELHTDSQ